jgi:hypothetical protein
LIKKSASYQNLSRNKKLSVNRFAHEHAHEQKEKPDTDGVGGRREILGAITRYVFGAKLSSRSRRSVVGIQQNRRISVAAFPQW